MANNEIPSANRGTNRGTLCEIMNPVCDAFIAANSYFGAERRIKLITALTIMVVEIAFDRCTFLTNERFASVVTRQLPRWVKSMNQSYNGCYDENDLKLLRIYHQSVKDISANASSRGRSEFGQEFVKSATIIRTAG